MSTPVTILLIEDERSIADNICLSLENENWSVTWHSSFHEGLKAAKSSNWSLILLDVGLPDGNGFSLCKQIREFSQVPIFFLTARASEVDRIVGFEFGADDYMTKPFSPRELVLRIKAMLKRTGSEVNLSQAGPFAIDEGKHKITYFEKDLELSRYEFKVLKLLLSRPGHVYTREKLMELVWDSPEMSMDRTVDTHIKSLRAKMKAIKPELNPIETHRGLGYSFKESLDEI